nr:millepattes peptide 5 [Nasonia vitripennis]
MTGGEGEKSAVVVRGREETSSTNLRRSVWSINIRKGRHRKLPEDEDEAPAAR